MSQAVRERIPELAVLKCLGFTDRSILALVLAESFLLCFIGALAGLLLASVVTGLLPPEYPIKADGRVWLFALVTTVFLAIVVGLPPAWRAMRLKIVDALAGR
jgi:putative ABC transport system permease protein